MRIDAVDMSWRRGGALKTTTIDSNASEHRPQINHFSGVRVAKVAMRSRIFICKRLASALLIGLVKFRCIELFAVAAAAT